jgi:hypothetical protein
MGWYIPEYPLENQFDTFSNDMFLISLLSRILKLSSQLSIKAFLSTGENTRPIRKSNTRVIETYLKKFFNLRKIKRAHE